jgi:hypothetical protein
MSCHSAHQPSEQTTRTLRKINIAGSGSKLDTMPISKINKVFQLDWPTAKTIKVVNRDLGDRARFYVSEHPLVMLASFASTG